MPQPDAAHVFDRRHFLRFLGLAGLGVMAPAGRSLAQAPTPPAGTAPAPPPPAAPAPITDDARFIAGVLRRRYSTHLVDDAGWESVMRDLDGDMAAGKRLRAFPLANADEPDVTFRA